MENSNYVNHSSVSIMLTKTYNWEIEINPETIRSDVVHRVCTIISYVLNDEVIKANTLDEKLALLKKERVFI